MEFLLKGGSENLYFLTATTAPESACEELSEGAQPMFLLLHLHQETENGQIQERVFSAQNSVWYHSTGTWALDVLTGRGSGIICSALSRHLWGLHLWAHMGWGAGTEVLLLAAEFAGPKTPQKGVLLSPCGAKRCLSILWSSPAVYSRFSVVQLGAWFVSSQRTLLTNAPRFSIKEVREFWILFFLKKWLILHTVFLHLSLIYDALIEAGGVWRKFLLKFS